MFRHHESKLYLRRQFENRTWKKDETFQEYLHYKTIMGNKVPVEKDELLEYAVEGIPDVMMRDQARIQGFSKENVNTFFTILKSELEKINFDATRIFNVDGNFNRSA